MNLEVRSKRLKDKVVLITGSGRGIGRCQALAFAREGAKVIVNDIGEDNGVSRTRAVVTEILAADGEAIASRDNISTLAGAKAAVGLATDTFGGLDVLVNNAGLRAANRVEELSEEEWDLVIDSHLKATFLMTKFAVPAFRNRGGGLIINTGSEAGMGMVFNSAYAAAKEGIAGFTRTIARELGYQNIRCNMILPRALVDTGGAAFGESTYAAFVPLVRGLGRFWYGNRGHTLNLDTINGQTVRPEHVAEFVVWLATPAAEKINGAAFFVAGDEVGLVSEPDVVQTIAKRGDWSVQDMDDICRRLTVGMENRFHFTAPADAIVKPV